MLSQAYIDGHGLLLQAFDLLSECVVILEESTETWKLLFTAGQQESKKTHTGSPQGIIEIYNTPSRDL